MEQTTEAPQQPGTGTSGTDNGQASKKQENSLLSSLKELWQNIRNSRLLTKFILLLILLMLAFTAWRAWVTPQWIFSVKASTGIIELQTPADGEIRWRVNDAIICSRGELQSPDAKLSKLKQTDSPCGSTAWSGYRFRDPEQTLVLNGSFRVLIERRSDGALYLSLRDHRAGSQADITAAANTDGDTPAKPPPQARLTFTDGTPAIVLGNNGRLKINIIWPGTNKDTSGFSTDRVFPFTGVTTIGRDINWTGTSMLQEGTVNVYTADDSPDKREQVDEAELLLGDQLRLENALRDDELIPPKGFIRYQPGGDALDVIAFGAADRVRIERYGDNGYNFRPGPLSKLLHDPLFIFVLTAFVGFISLVGTVDAMCSTRSDCK